MFGMQNACFPNIGIGSASADIENLNIGISNNGYLKYQYNTTWKPDTIFLDEFRAAICSTEPLPMKKFGKRTNGAWIEKIK